MKYIFTSLFLFSFVVYSQVIPVNFDHISQGAGIKDGKIYSIGSDKGWTQEDGDEETVTQFICLDASTYDTLWTKRYITEFWPEDWALGWPYEIGFSQDSIIFTNKNFLNEVHVVSIDYNGNTNIGQHEMVFGYDNDDTVHYSIVGKVFSGYEYTLENRTIGDFEYYVGNRYSNLENMRQYYLDNGPSEVFLYKVLNNNPVDSVFLGHMRCGFNSTVPCDTEYDYFKNHSFSEKFYTIIGSEIVIGNLLTKGDESDWTLLGKNSKNRIRTFDSNLNLTSDTVFSLENDDSSLMIFNDVYEKNGGVYFDFIHWTIINSGAAYGSDNTLLFYKDNNIISSFNNDNVAYKKFDDSGNIYFMLNYMSSNEIIRKTDSEFNLIEEFTFELDSFVSTDFFISEDDGPIIIAYKFDSATVDEWFRTEQLANLPLGTSIVHSSITNSFENSEENVKNEVDIFVVANSLCIKGVNGNASYLIYDLSGRKVAFDKFNGNKIIDISNLPSSVFFVEILEKDTEGKTRIYRKKVLK